MPTNHRVDMCADRRISVSLSMSHSGDQCSLTLHQSDAELHIVTDNKATSVETLIFSPKETFSPKVAEVKWAAPGGDTFCHICYPENPQLG